MEMQIGMYKLEMFDNVEVGFITFGPHVIPVRYGDMKTLVKDAVDALYASGENDEKKGEEKIREYWSKHWQDDKVGADKK